MKLCVIITVSQNLYSLYRKQFSFLISKGYDITAIAAPGPEHEFLRKQGVKTIELNMVKRPSPFLDLISLFKLWKHLLFNRYDVISISTPKASLLGALGSYFSFHKNVIFTLRGRAYENEFGVKKKFYVLIDKLICRISNKVFCISNEIMNDVVNNGIVPKSKIFVLGKGSSNGVDLSIFTKNKELIENANIIRSRLRIDSNDIVLLYSGRLRNDKGIRELLDAFELIGDDNCHLIIQGEFDDTDPISKVYKEKININERVHLEGWSFKVEEYFACADIFVFPSYREGFGNVAIEASAMELPVVGFDVIGCRESIVNNETGILVEAFSVDAFADSVGRLIMDKELRQSLGRNGRIRIEQHFDSLILWEKLERVYSEMMNK